MRSGPLDLNRNQVWTARSKRDKVRTLGSNGDKVRTVRSDRVEVWTARGRSSKGRGGPEGHGIKSKVRSGRLDLRKGGPTVRIRRGGEVRGGNNARGGLDL